MTRIVTLILVCGFLLLVAIPAKAGNCGFPRRVIYSTPATYSTPIVNTVYEKETIIAPVAIPVVVPATVFQYLPALAPVQAVGVGGYGVGATQPQAGYTPIQPQAQPTTAIPSVQAAGPNTAEIDRLIKSRLEFILKEYSQTLDVNSPPPIRFGEQTTTPTAISEPVGNIDVVGRYRLALKSNCVDCHGNGRRSGGVQLFDTAGSYAPNVTEQQISEAISSGRMPKNRKLSAVALLDLLHGSVRR